MKESIKKLWKFLKDVDKVKLEIKTNEDGAWISKNGKHITGIRWDEIIEITAGKLDRWSYDPIYVFCKKDGNNENGVGFEELIEGFEEFTNELEKRFDIDCNWQSRINEGAFKPNWEILWPQPKEEIEGELGT